MSHSRFDISDYNIYTVHAHACVQCISSSRTKKKHTKLNEIPIPAGNFFKYVSTDFCRMNGSWHCRRAASAAALVAHSWAYSSLISRPVCGLLFIFIIFIFIFRLYV